MYEVHWCLVGKDPDSKPFLFDDYPAAASFLADELYWLSGDDGLDASDTEAVQKALNHLNKSSYNNEPSDFQLAFKGISYWLIERTGALTLPEF